MALKINKLPRTPDGALADPSAPADLISDRNLYLDASKTRLVEETDPESRWVLCGAGGTIPGADVQALGLTLVDGRVVQQNAPPRQPAPEPEQPSTGQANPHPE